MADIPLTITIPDRHVSKVKEWLDAEYPKRNGETTVEQAKRMINTLISKNLFAHKKKKTIENALISIEKELEIIE